MPLLLLAGQMLNQATVVIPGFVSREINVSRLAKIEFIANESNAGSSGPWCDSGYRFGNPAGLFQLIG